MRKIKAMNILFLSEVFYPHGGGAELATYLYASLLREEGFSVIVVTNKFSGDLPFSESNSLKIYRLPLFKDLSSTKYSILKRFDVIFSSFFNDLLRWADVVYVPRFWFSAITMAKFHKKPVIFHMHDYIAVCSVSNLFKKSEVEVCSRRGILCSPKCILEFEKSHGSTFGETLSSVALNSIAGRWIPRLATMADAIVCVSKKQEELVVKRERKFRQKSCVIYNPFPCYPEPEEFGDDFGYFGGSDDLKGFRVLFHSAQRINGTRSNPIRIHCTKLPASIEFAETMKRFGLLPYPKLEVAELDRLYQKLKAVLIPSVWNEPWPYVTVEALVRGRFVIGSNIGGIPEQIEGCKGAILCEPGNVKMLADSIEYVDSLRKDALVELGHQNRETFLKRFNNYSSVRKFISLCEKLV
jgi:glycosyltransferase involved in cell wall biosynthesis